MKDPGSQGLETFKKEDVANGVFLNLPFWEVKTKQEDAGPGDHGH